MKQFLFQFKYISLQLIKEKQFMFWMIAFPMILCSCFYLAFSNLDKPTKLNIKVGITPDNALSEIMESIPIFTVLEEKEELLQNKLLNKEISGYIDSKYKVNVAESSTSTNIFVSVVEQIQKHAIASMIKTNAETPIGLTNQQILALRLKDIAPYLANIPESEFRQNTLISSSEIVYKNQDSSILKIILFTAFGMFSMYGLYISSGLMEIVQGYLSTLAARVSISPYKKGALVLNIFIISILFGIVFNLLIVLFVKFALGITLFTNLKLTALVFMVAILYSTSLGILFGTVKQLTAGSKTGIITVTLLFFSFLCGMGGRSFRQYFEQNIPILNRINPVNLVNEALYRVNYIGDTTYLARNMGILIVFTVVLLIISSIILRRKSYDSL